MFGRAANVYIPGTHTRECDLCGFEWLARDMKRRHPDAGGGLVCPRCYDPRPSPTPIIRERGPGDRFGRGDNSIVYTNEVLAPTLATLTRAGVTSATPTGTVVNLTADPACTLAGTLFTRHARVRIDAAIQPTTYVSATSVTFTWPPALIVVGTYLVDVQNLLPFGATGRLDSNDLTMTVQA